MSDDPAYNECDALLALLDDDYDAMIAALRDDPASLHEVVLDAPVLPLMDAFRTLVDALPERHDDLRSLLAMRIETLPDYYDPDVRAHDLSSLTDMHDGLIRVTPYAPRAHPTSAPAMETPQTLKTMIEKSEQMYQKTLKKQMEDIEHLPEPQRTTFLKRAKLMDDYTALQHKALLYYYNAAAHLVPK